jgi:hypothetical protein
MPQAATPEPVDDASLLSRLLQPSALQVSCLAARLTSLRALQRFWAAGDPKAMLQHLRRVHDPSIAVDVLRAGALTNCQLDLEGALLLLPLLRKVRHCHGWPFSFLLLRSADRLAARSFSVHGGMAPACRSSRTYLFTRPGRAVCIPFSGLAQPLLQAACP